MEDATMSWTLRGLPNQRIELHTGGAAEAAGWASARGGGVTVVVAKQQPKPSVPAAQWQGNKRCISVNIPTHPKGPLSGAHNQPHEVPGLLAKAYTGALALAAERDLRRVAFPALGCGGGRHVYPPDAAARVAIRCCVLGALTAEISTIAFFLDNEPVVARAWITAVEDELSAGTLAEVAPPAPEEDRAPGWRFRLAERRQREAEQTARAATVLQRAQDQPEPEPEPQAHSIRNVQNEDLFVESASESESDSEEASTSTGSVLADRDEEEEAEEEDGDAQAFVVASSLVSTIQPFASATTTSPPLPDAEDGGGSAAFRAHLHKLVEDPVKVELALMERRYFDSWKVLRTSPDLSVSFLFVPSDPDFLPRFRKSMQALLPVSSKSGRAGPIGLTLELTLPQDYPSTNARVAVSTPIPTTHREAVACLAQDFLTSSDLHAAGAENSQPPQQRRPRLRAMVRHVDRQISTAWEEADREAGAPKIEVAWVDAPAEGGSGANLANSHTAGAKHVCSDEEEDVQLWESARHAAFQVCGPIPDPLGVLLAWTEICCWAGCSEGD